MGSQSYKDLLVWQKSVTLCTQIYPELDTQRIIAANLNLIDSESNNSLDYDIAEIRKMLYALRASLRNSTVRTGIN